jgi:hypothetical protein
MAEGFNPFGSLLSGFGGGGTMTVIYAIIIGLGGLFIAGFIVWFFWRRSAYNLRVEFKLPRSVKYLNAGSKVEPNDVSGFIDCDWGKARYDSKTGVVWLKRKGKKAVPMKPFQISRYLQGTNLLTVVQVGAKDYVPVMPESYAIYQDENGEEATLLSLRADTTESRAWKNSFEREAKSAYSITSLLQQYAPILAIGLVIILWGIQFIMIRRGICGG